MTRMRANRRSMRLLRWVFRRGNHLVTCQLDREGREAAYMLSLVPHWDVRQAVVMCRSRGGDHLVAFVVPRRDDADRGDLAALLRARACSALPKPRAEM